MSAAAEESGDDSTGAVPDRYRRSARRVRLLVYRALVPFGVGGLLAAAGSLSGTPSLTTSGIGLLAVSAVIAGAAWVRSRRP